jgi:hypothetical protein
MEGWSVAAALFAAGAFGVALWAEIRRYRSRPTWYWSAALATRKDDSSRHRVALELIGDDPAYHVTVEGFRLHLDGRLHGDAHDRGTWPHLASVVSGHEPIVLYVEEDQTSEDAHLLVTWTVAPVRRERFFQQRVSVDPDASAHRPCALGPLPVWRRFLHRPRSRSAKDRSDRQS